MSILKKRSILKLAATFMLVAMMAGAFTMHSSVAKAADGDPCGPGNSVAPGVAASGTPNCAVAIHPAIPGDLTFTSDPNVTLTAAAVGSNTFSFGSIVTDERGTAGGWQLQAASTGLTRIDSTGGTINVKITGGSGTCAAASGFATDSCLTPASSATSGAPLTLSTTAQTILSEIAGTGNVYSTVTSVSNGTYTIPTGALPGSYTGTITLSLVNSAT